MLLHEELTGKILEACFEVSNELGSGFLESVYEKALLVALRQKGLHVLRTQRNASYGWPRTTIWRVVRNRHVVLVARPTGIDDSPAGSIQRWSIQRCG